MLRYTFNNLWLLFHEVKIALRRCIFYEGEKMFHVVKRSFKHGIYKFISQCRNVTYFGDHSVHIFFMYPPQNRWFNCFNNNRAWDFFSEAFNGSHSLLFKKELEGHVFAIVIKPNANASLFN